MKNKIAIIGTGSFATAISKILFDAGHKDLILYGIDKKEMKDLSKGNNKKYFPGVSLPKFNTTDNMSKAVQDAEYIILGVPSRFIGDVFSELLNALDHKALIINGAKGFYPGTEDALHIGLEKASKGNKNIRGIVSLLGPSHAEEMVRGVPTSVSVVTKDKKIAKEVQSLINNEYFRCYVQTDVIGAEVGAAYKNVLAIASGLSKGLGYGVNTQAALLTRGLVEMQKFNSVMGGKPETIYGLTGIGDLIVTATSELSRNFRFGLKLAKDGVEAISKNTMTVEGLVALDYIQKISSEHDVDLPLVNSLYSLIHKKELPEKVIKELWSRKLKEE